MGAFYKSIPDGHTSATYALAKTSNFNLLSTRIVTFSPTVTCKLSSLTWPTVDLETPFRHGLQLRFLTGENF